MADLEQMRAFASAQSFNLTGALLHSDHVVPLANRWQPLIRLHEDERFGPIGLDGLALIPREVFRQVDPAAQRALEIDVTVPDIGGTTVTRTFPPPVLRVPNPQGAGDLVLNENDDTLTPFARTEVGERAVLTHGEEYDRSNAIFGSLQTINGLAEPSPGDPRLPRHDIKVVAELRMVKEALHYFLRVEAADAAEYPKGDDSIWDVTSFVRLFFRDVSGPSSEAAPFATSLMNDIVLRVLDGEAAAVLDIPPGWSLSNDVLETARNCAILEYYFIYAYNDYDHYEDWPANYHEGDDEGCCYIFDRRELERHAVAGDADGVVQVPPLYLITSVHLERQQADRIMEFDAIGPNEVFVARGSHATYPTSGSHDFLSPTEAFEEGLDLPPTWLSILSLGTVPLLLGLAVLIGEHFKDSNDETSEGGIATGNDEQVPPELVGDPRFRQCELAVTPLSEDEHIYQGTSPTLGDEDQQLGLLSYAGKLGADDEGLGNVSPVFERKTGRFFRKLISAGKRIN